MSRWREVRGRLKYTSRLLGRSAFAPMEGEFQLPLPVSSEELGVTFIGHSSFLLQVGGQNIVCDPVFAWWLILLRRLRRPGVHVSDMPPIDLVLLSHAHLDHLNRPSLRKLIRHTKRLTGRAPIAVVPQGVADVIDGLGFERIISLEWWESAQLGSLTITHTPAKHWGTRWFNDHDRGFGGYVIEGGAKSLYYSGDTAYFNGFREIGRRFTPEVALLPIGAYNPDSYRNVHTNPEDALLALRDLGAATMVPMHYGTFWLSEEPVTEPLPRLLASAGKMGLSEKIRVVREGETAVFNSPAREHAHTATSDGDR